MKCIKTKPCNDCPFRRVSLPGWIGNWDKPEDLLTQSESEVGLPCHTSYNNEKRTLADAIKSAHVCVGSLQSANNSCKLYRNKALAGFAKKVGKNSDVLTAWEFVEHHNSTKIEAKTH